MKHIAKAAALMTFLFITLTASAKQEEPSADLQIGAVTEVDAELQAHIDEAFELLKENGKTSTDVWPEYDLSQNAIIVCQRDDVTDKVIHAWKLTTEEKCSLTNEDFSGVEIPAAGSYNSVDFQGIKSIILAVSKDTMPALKSIACTNFIYEIGVHEMVHFHYESMLKLTKLALEQKLHGGRGTAFPKAAEPRVYRKMLYDNLVSAFGNPKEEALYLGRAKYWNEKWKNEYPEEYYQAKITDIMEGKARYIQYMLCIPNNLSDPERSERISNLFDKSVNPSVSIDSESYKLGFAAGVLLDRQGSDWKKQITKKPKPLVDYLLDHVEIIEDDSEDYEEKFKTSKEQMAVINEEIDAKLEHIKKAEHDTEIPFLQIKGKYLEGSFETSDFVNYLDKNLIIDFGGTFKSKTGTITCSHFSVYEQSGLIKNTYLLPLTMEHRLSDGRLIIDSEHVSGNIAVKQTKNKDGRIIYTMK